MSLRKVSHNLRVLAAEDHCFLVFKNKEGKNVMMKVPCLKGEPVDDIIKRHKNLEDKLGKLRDVMDANYVSIMPPKTVEKFYKVTFSKPGGGTHEETIPNGGLKRTPEIIAAALKAYKAKGSKEPLGGVLGIENEEGVLLFDPVRDLAKRFSR